MVGRRNEPKLHMFCVERGPQVAPEKSGYRALLRGMDDTLGFVPFI
jgi:hypothetical protein